jgi:hypothetical protein
MSMKLVQHFIDYVWGVSSGIEGRQQNLRYYMLGDGDPQSLNNAIEHDLNAVIFMDDSLDYDRSDSAARYVKVSGGLGFSGDEIVVQDELAIETISYAESAHVNIDGPVYVAINDAADIASFMADCRQFADDGILPSVLARKNYLFEAGGLLGNCLCKGRRRVTIHSDGSFSSSPIGQTASTIKLLPLAPLGSPCRWCLPDLRQSVVSEYLMVAAAVAMRRIRHPWERVEVSGAGRYFDPRIEEYQMLEQKVADIALMRSDGEYVALRIDTMDVFRLAADAAIVLEWLIWCDHQTAVRQIARRFDITIEEAEIGRSHVLADLGLSAFTSESMSQRRCY